jgi:single-stranded DNA-binding protein
VGHIFEDFKMQVYGNIGQNAKTLVSKAGRPFVSFTLAESYGKRGEDQVTTWYQVNAFGLDDTVVARLLKGTRVKVLGRVTANPYVDKATGEARASLTILASSVEIQTRPDEEAEPRQQAAARQAVPAAKPAVDPFDDFDAPAAPRVAAPAKGAAKADVFEGEFLDEAPF